MGKNKNWKKEINLDIKSNRIKDLKSVANEINKIFSNIVINMANKIDE